MIAKPRTRKLIRSTFAYTHAIYWHYPYPFNVGLIDLGNPPGNTLERNIRCRRPHRLAAGSFPRRFSSRRQRSRDALLFDNCYMIYEFYNINREDGSWRI